MKQWLILWGLGIGFGFGLSSESTLGQGVKDKTPAKPAAKQPPKVEKKEATPPELIATLPGFHIELLHTADPQTEGSWIAMCKDHRGRLIISGQPGQPILRATLQEGKVAQWEKLQLPISGAMGMLYAFDSLYINGIGPKGFGLYRCKDTRGTDQYDSVELLKRFEGGGEHGPHGVALGPDQRIYVINGNHTKVPEGLSERSPHKNYREDLLLPRQWDGNGHAAGILAPGGYVVRTDAEGKDWELVLAGFRNAYDLAFNGDGELFTFDSDMEWDWGMPWYRPIRVNHCVSAAEFGWRSGTGKWPSYYPDSLPATVDIGIGSPTGVATGTGAKFPAKYQKALYVMDWTYGRILAVHLQPQGSSYTATFENFVAPLGLVQPKAPKRPLNVTDMVIGEDGALYFTIGGRNTQAALYRVSYRGPESTAPADLKNAAGAEARALRRTLESFHGQVHPRAIETAWPHLGSTDRFLAYAARLAIEAQPVAQWKAKALAEKEPRTALLALLALARVADRNTQPALLQTLATFPLAGLDDTLKLTKLRVIQLSLIRQGRPGVEWTKKLIAELDPLFPGQNERVNRELAQVLIALNAPGIAAKCLTQMANAKTQEDQLFYLFHLRTLPLGFWTLEQRKEYLRYFTKERKKLPPPPEMLTWFEQAGRGYSDGASFNNFMRNFLREAVANFSDEERKALASIVESIDKNLTPTFDVKPRPVVKAWKYDEVLPLLAKSDKGRNFDRGKEAYFAASCIKCHRFGEIGGAVGPDLTAIASRFDRKAMLESILEPSKVISDQYQNEEIVTTTGKLLIGRVVDESPDWVVLQPNPLEATRIEIKKSEIESRQPSKVSPMPANLADVLTADEILDLIAYLESGGNRSHRVFQK